MKILHCEQGSQEWFDARLGIITMSEAQCLMVDPPKSSGLPLGKGAFTYMDKIAAERITGIPADTWRGNFHTDRGKRLEPEAIDYYLETRPPGSFERVGIVLNHDVGCSPDLLAGSDGMVEVKTKLPNIQFDILRNKEIPKEHETQLQGGLWVCEREWIDFVCYSEGMPTFIKRVYRNDKYIEKLARRCRIFYQLLDQRIERMITEDHLGGYNNVR